MPILDLLFLTFCQTHEKYPYGIPYDITIDLLASASLRQEFATEFLTQNYPSRFFD
jgi:hypothetical protein